MKTRPEKKPRHVARLLAKIGGYFLLGVILLVALLLVAINVGPVSQLVATKVNAVLEPTFKGRIVLRRLGYLDFGGLTGTDVEIFDPAGQSVVRAQGIDVRLNWPAVAYRAATSGSEPLRIPIDRIAIEHVAVQVLDDGAGMPTLAHAFEPRVPEPLPKPETPAPTLVIDELTVESTEVRGALGGVGPIDTDLIGLKAQLRNDAAGLALTLAQLDIAARQVPQVQRVNGRLKGEVMLPAAAATTPTPPADSRQTSTALYALRPAPVPRRVLLTFAGDVAGSGAALDVSLVDKDLLASFEAAELTPATLTQLVPSLAATAPLALSAKVQGLLDDLGFEAKVQQQAASINAHGRFKAQNAHSHVTAQVETSEVNLAHFMATAPSTRLNLGADATFDFDNAGGRGKYRVVSQGSRFGVEALPRAVIAGEIEMPSKRPLVTQGTLDIAEPGAATRLLYDVQSGDKGLLAKVSSTTEIDRPARVQELAGLSATGDITTQARYDSAADRLDAKVDVRLRDVRHPQLSVRQITASVAAEGSAELPTVQLRASLGQVKAAGRVFSRMLLTAQGTPERLEVGASVFGKNPDRVDLRATLMPKSDRLVQAPTLNVTNGRNKLHVAVQSIALGDERFRIDGLTVKGPGSAEVSLVYGKSLERLDLTTDQLDAAALLEMFGVKSQLQSAKANLKAHFASHGRQPSGTFVADVSDIAMGKVQGSARADLQFARGKLSGTAGIELARGGKTDIVLKDLVLPLGALSASDLERMTGDVSLKGDLDLSQLSSLLPLVGVERGEGHLKYDVVIQRAPNSERPAVWQANIASKSLVLIGQRPDVGPTKSAEQARQTAPWNLRGIDLDVEARLENQAARVRGKLFDTTGDLIVVEADWTGITGTRDLMDPTRALFQAPFTAHVRVPPRSLEKLPAPIRPAEIEGTLALQVDAEGTLADPRVKANLKLDQFSPASEREEKRVLLDVQVGAEYAQAGGSMKATAQQRANARQQAHAVLALDSRWTGDARLLADAAGGKSPIQANADVKLDDFPIGIVPMLRNSHVRGKVSGTARLLEFGKDAHVELDLRTQKLKVDRLLVEKIEAAVRTAGGALVVDARLSGGEGGSASAKLNTSMTWGDRVVPTLDQQRVEGTVETQALRLGALQPLVEGALSELDGKLDSSFTATMRGGQPAVTGHARLTEGVVHLPSVGQRFTNIDAEMNVTPESVRIDKLTARGISGGFEANAKATLHGLSATAAELGVRIKEKDKLPLTIEGESIGDAWGSFQATYTRDEPNKTNNVHVNLQKLYIELPEAPPQGIQDLGQPEHIRVGYRRQDRDFVSVPLQLLEEPAEPSDEKTVVVVDLVSVGVKKGQQARVTLGGKIQATLADELDVQGKIETKQGTLDIQGKTFDIERASVAFTGGKPDDPTISAVARYDSPAGYAVYAEYNGTVTRGRLVLRADPPLSQDEVLTLLMFGTPDGSLGAGSGGDSLSTAVSVAGGAAAQGLNRAFSDITNLDVSARVDTSTGAPRPELVLQLTPRVAAKVTQALGEPSPGQSPDRTFLTVELRLLSAWSLSTMVGDRGASALDLIWRRRY